MFRDLRALKLPVVTSTPSLTKKQTERVSWFAIVDKNLAKISKLKFLVFNPLLLRHVHKAIEVAFQKSALHKHSCIP